MGCQDRAEARMADPLETAQIEHRPMVVLLKPPVERAGKQRARRQVENTGQRHDTDLAGAAGHLSSAAGLVCACAGGDVHKRAWTGVAEGVKRRVMARTSGWWLLGSAAIASR